MTRVFLLLAAIALISGIAGLFLVQFSRNHRRRMTVASVTLFCLGLLFMGASFAAPTW